MFAALLYSTAGLALTSVGLLGVMAVTAFASIFFAVIGGKYASQPSALHPVQPLAQLPLQACLLTGCYGAGIMFASFVGVVATTLVFASFGLVAVSSSVATGAAAGALLCFTPLHLAVHLCQATVQTCPLPCRLHINISHRTSMSRANVRCMTHQFCSVPPDLMLTYASAQHSKAALSLHS